MNHTEALICFRTEVFFKNATYRNMSGQKSITSSFVEYYERCLSVIFERCIKCDTILSNTFLTLCVTPYTYAMNMNFVSSYTINIHSIVGTSFRLPAQSRDNAAFF